MNPIRLYILGTILVFCFGRSVSAQTNLRAWHNEGQTFLVWEHQDNQKATDTYEIYRSTSPFQTLTDGLLAGKVFADCGSNHRLHEFPLLENARWILPAGEDGSYTVSEDEAYFVYTPHQAGDAHYAVVRSGVSTISLDNTVGVTETIAPVTCHLQYEGILLTVYGHWIDGRNDENSGRAAYPVMGNESANGHGFNFAVWKPITGLPAGIVPLVCLVHGGYGNLMDQWRSATALVPSGLLATFDDGLQHYNVLEDSLGDSGTFWFGYRKGMDRFNPSIPLTADTVINYTSRRLLWEIDWIKQHYPVDENRISMTGASMGSVGTLYHTRAYPHLFSAGLAHVPLLAGLRKLIDPERIYGLYGLPFQNFVTNVEDNAPVYDLFDQTWRLDHAHEDWPFTIMMAGKNDERIAWADNLPIYRQLDEAKTGDWLYWDQRSHSQWLGHHFQPSTHVSFNYLTRFRNDQSYPAFSEMDADPDTPGRQPDPGSGDPNNGDPWGTWGGYMEWDPLSIVDEQDTWSVTLWVMFASPYECDIYDSDVIRVDVTPRCLQNFYLNPGTNCQWQLVKVSNDELLQSGSATVDESGHITIQNLLLIKEACTLTIRSAGTVVHRSTCSLSPDTPRLMQNFPNPFNPVTRINFTVPKGTDIQLAVHDVRGRMVQMLAEGLFNAGIHAVQWDASSLSSGIYIIRLQTEKYMLTQKCILME